MFVDVQFSEDIVAPSKRGRPNKSGKPPTAAKSKRAKVEPEQNCLIADDRNFAVGQQVSDPDLESLVDSELLAEAEPEPSDCSEGATAN